MADDDSASTDGHTAQQAARPLGDLLDERDGVRYYRTPTGAYIAAQEHANEHRDRILASAFPQGRGVWNLSTTGLGLWTRLAEPCDWRDHQATAEAAVRVLHRFLAHEAAT